MNTRNTPVHGYLWHKDFAILALSELFLTISVYMQLPVFLKILFAHRLFSVRELSVAVGVYGAGLFLLGPFCAWLTQRFRRNKVYLTSTSCMAGVFSFVTLYGGIDKTHYPHIALWGICLLFGAFYGLSKRVLTGTLLTDKSESSLRTKANCCSSWISRFSLVIGSAISLLLLNYSVNTDIHLISISLMVLSIIFVCFVNFPFKTPDEEVKIFSCDRFFMPLGWKYFLMMTLLSAFIGLVFVLHHDRALFYVMFIPGFVVAMLTETMFEDNSRGLISEIISCLSLLCVAVTILFYSDTGKTIYCLAPFFIGMSLEYAGSRILMSLVGKNKHCRRSTAISTYFLASEGGLAFGLCLGCLEYENIEQMLLLVIFFIILMSVAVCRNVRTILD